MSELLHPDADQLNAFVEQALPAHEREQTLAHLAECAACRQVVALSLPPMMQPEAARAPRYFGAWYSGWRLAWAGVPALAVVILLAVFLRSGRMPTPAVTQTDNARVVSPAQIPAPSPPSATLPSHPQYAPGDESGVVGGIMGGVAGMSAKSPAVGNHTVEFLSTERALPSHLPALSTVSHGSRRLAIDTRNHVFFSADEGRHWQPVPPQWQGRAMSVAFIGQPRSPVPKYAFGPPTVPSGAASISGRVTDPTTAVIAGTTVTATDSHENVARAVTDGHGQFRLQHLAAGRYRIEAEAPGFVKRSRTADVTGKQHAVVNLTLPLAAAAQAVTVESAPKRVDRLSAPAPHTQGFELTTEDGSRWLSQDGLSWSRE